MFLHLIDRDTAIAFGLKRFFTGVPCRRGGVAQRFAKNGTCTCRECLIVKSKQHAAYRYGEPRERLLEAKRAHYSANCDRLNAEKSARRMKDIDATRAREKARRDGRIEEARAITRRSYEKHREKRNAESRKNYHANRVEQRRQQSIYTKLNPEIFIARNARRRAAREERVPPWYGELDEFVMREAASLCKARRRATGFDWHVDHILPLKGDLVSGLHCAANLQVIPASLNLSKGNRLIAAEVDAWLAYI